jgi:DNA-binding transcriptional MerR regulator
MDELVERVREALTAEYPGAPNGRVRDLPDRRAIRWYTTIGLVDKPLGMRGRTALYGPRHLQQLVAIKRRQSEGRSLAEIQVEFSWLSPEQLDEVSRVPQRLLVADGGLTPDHSAGAARLRFWAESPSASPPPPPLDRTSPDTAGQRVTTRPVATDQVSAVALGGGVILLVPHTVDDRDRGDIAAAAAPLLTLLAARGLTDGSSQ